MLPQTLGSAATTCPSLENIVLPARLTRGARSRPRPGPDELLDKLGLSHLADPVPDQVSLGEQQRIAIAARPLLRPRLLWPTNRPRTRTWTRPTRARPMRDARHERRRLRARQPPPPDARGMRPRARDGDGTMLRRRARARRVAAMSTHRSERGVAGGARHAAVARGPAPAAAATRRVRSRSSPPRRSWPWRRRPAPLFLSTIGTAALHAQAVRRCPENSEPGLPRTDPDGRRAEARAARGRRCAAHGLPAPPSPRRRGGGAAPTLVHLFADPAPWTTCRS